MKKQVSNRNILFAGIIFVILLITFTVFSYFKTEKIFATPEKVTSATRINSNDIVVKLQRQSDSMEFIGHPENGKLEAIPFTDFSFVVLNLNRLVDPRTITPYVYALQGTKEEFQRSAFFPEDSMDNIVKNKHTLSGDLLKVESAEGNFPQNSQIVLSIYVGDSTTYGYRIFTEPPVKHIIKKFFYIQLGRDNSKEIEIEHVEPEETY